MNTDILLGEQHCVYLLKVLGLELSDATTFYEEQS